MFIFDFIGFILLAIITIAAIAFVAYIAFFAVTIGLGVVFGVFQGIWELLKPIFK